ncbi:uncharacterized protein LOC125035009 [Penaeus chinensis]|uniref:uncharacterized protein LOC125035009 n=1 Tax=Penaeus chinensis TaxID=139456 RepID=UPI001FB6D807|nr:uncharacterized protein LOC125035009 [Penaeus chinensis]
MTKGVRQGDTLSPVMFTDDAEEIFIRMNTEEAGIRINGKKKNYPRFVEDIIIFCESEEQLKNLLDTLKSDGKKDGRKLNKKTKFTCKDIARTKQIRGIEIGGEKLGEVEEYTYLGRLLTPDNKTS